MVLILFLIFGAALGATLRWQLGVFIPFLIYGSINYSTLIANALAALIAGMMLGIQSQMMLADHWRLFFLIGFCGSLSTFSSFSLEGFVLLQQAKLMLFVLHAALHFFVSLLMIAGGYYLAMLSLKFLTSL